MNYIITYDVDVYRDRYKHAHIKCSGVEICTVAQPFTWLGAYISI